MASTNSPVKVLSADCFHGEDVSSMEQLFFLDFFSSIFPFHLLLLPDKNEGQETVSHGRKGKKRFVKQFKQLCNIHVNVSWMRFPGCSLLRRLDTPAARWARTRWALHWHHCSAILGNSGFTQGIQAFDTIPVELSRAKREITTKGLIRISHHYPTASRHLSGFHRLLKWTRQWYSSENHQLQVNQSHRGGENPFNL